MHITQLSITLATFVIISTTYLTHISVTYTSIYAVYLGAILVTSHIMFIYNKQDLDLSNVCVVFELIQDLDKRSCGIHFFKVLV